jgi:hypothetical protein
MINYEPITKEEFIEQNPFGTISKQNDDGSTTLLTQEEYDNWVEYSKGIWEELKES